MDLITEKIRKARKTHKCDFCGCQIKPGEQYNHQVYVDGYVYDFNCHLECEEIALLLDMYNSSWGEGVDGEAFEAFISEYLEEHYQQEDDIWEKDRHEQVLIILNKLKQNNVI